jgi:putative ABC transport system permease protein
MEIRPILSAMMRNKTGAILVALQIAITLAVVTNAVFIIDQRLEKMARDPGVDSPNLIFIQSIGYRPDYNHRNTIAEDLALLRAEPGVIAASPVSGVPLSGGGSSTGYRAKPGTDEAGNIPGNYYEVDEQGVEAFGVKLVAGRNFTPEIIQKPDTPTSEMVPELIITRAMAKELFGTDENAVGKPVYDSLGQNATVVGVIEGMLGAWPNWDKLPQVVFHPLVDRGPNMRYVVRAEPGQRDRLIPLLEKKLIDANDTRVITWVRPHDYFTERSYSDDRSMATLLGVLTVLLVTMTALGIVGLASYTVNARVKQIGTRRAMGARRVDILRYFMVENWLLTTIGLVIGCALAFVFSYWLSTAFELPKLNPLYVVSGVGLMWVIGQMAVFVPARRAAGVPPAIATRTV